jgi:mycothiol synthase
MQLPSQDLSVRPLTPDDLKDLTQLLITYDIALYGKSEQTEESVRANWQTASFHPETDSWGVFTESNISIAAAGVEQEAYIHFYPFAYVHPDYQGRGIGTYLLHIMEQWIHERLPLAPEHARVISAVGANSKNMAVHHLFEREGYQTVRRFWRMRIEMSEPPPQPQWATGITVRPYIRENDEMPTFEMVEEAFRDHWGHLPNTFEQWASEYLNRPSFDPALWFLACDDSRLVGGALCRYKQETGWVGKLAVLRPWRHKGVGHALLLHAFNEFYRRGTHDVELVVDAQNLTGAVRLYERVGMHMARENIAYEKEMRAGVEMSTQTI